MAKNKYQLMEDSTTCFDKDGNQYPDLTTFPLESLIVQTRPVDYKLTEMDTLRFFDLMYEYYGSFDFYDDIILWLSDIEDIVSEENFEKVIKLYSKKDLDNWYLQSLIGEEVKKSTSTVEDDIEDK